MNYNLAEMRAKWERFDARLREGDDVEGSLMGASFLIARSAVTDVNELLDILDRAGFR